MTTLLAHTLRHDSIYMPTPARVAEVKQFTSIEKWFRIALPSGYHIDHQPGQFVEMSVLGIGEAPISICSAPAESNGHFDVVVRSVGKLTNALHRLQAGQMVGVRGPFGRPFPMDKYRGKDILFVGGGLGLAPLRSVIAEVLAERGKYGRIMVLYGARSTSDFLFPEDLQAWHKRDDIEFMATVDKGSPDWTGNVGVITTLLPKVSFDARNTVAVTIGPPIMYKYVVRDLVARGIPDGNIWMSFERQMKCGVGKCGHCQMHHMYTCQSGPSFAYSEVKDLEEAL
jgi:sulfhydrogenase subunit gamma (sulfur reductase)